MISTEFLPIQSQTKGRWISIDKAHYEDIYLPPVDLYKIGEIYFVKDGNHRVSVARERGQEYMDAYVTEIDIPVMLTSDTTLDQLDLKQEESEFILETELGRLRPAPSSARWVYIRSCSNISARTATTWASRKVRSVV
jgi:hypothetical protein